ncbi:MAG: MGMT family protein [Nocardioidaceae bacterium]|nr:MGMT family protein [Nocardioidaceae bacterium]
MRTVDREVLIEHVLDLVEAVPPGRATTYGLLAHAVGFGGPRWVGMVLARHGAAVPWWRVVRADGSLPPALRREAIARYRTEGTPLRVGTDGRVVGVDLTAAAPWRAPCAARPESADRTTRIRG